MIAAAQLFTPGNADLTDFSKMSAGSIFNQSAVSGYNRMEQRDSQLQQDVTSNLSQPQNDYSLLANTMKRNVVAQEMDYNAPIQDAVPQRPQVQSALPQTSNTSNMSSSIKLSNYGYDSDSSPDYNSNVRRVGHADNPLQDGLSAALTKSLAVKHGLKTGQMFEAVMDDGTILKRRYDDTVPDNYKGRALPETVDLYELSGKNSFGGEISEIRPII